MRDSGLHPEPVPRPRDWGGVHQPVTEAEVKPVRHSVNGGTPLGGETWMVRMARAASGSRPASPLADVRGRR